MTTLPGRAGTLDDMNDDSWRLWFRRADVLGAAIAPGTLLATRSGGSLLPAPGSGCLYWANTRGFGRACLDGTGVNQQFITAASHPGMIAVSSGSLYWTDAGGFGAPDIGHQPGPAAVLPAFNTAGQIPRKQPAERARQGSNPHHCA